MITVVILPGMDGTGIELTDFVAALAPEVEAIVVTYPNDRPMDYAGHEAVARTSLPIDRPFVLLGESYSGPIAISIAASAPPGLIGLVLCCSFARTRDRRSRGYVGSCRSCRRASRPLFPAGSCWGGFRRRGSITPSLKFSLKSTPAPFELA